MVSPSNTRTAFRALENALAIDALGYVCAPATTLETAVTEYAPVKGADGKWQRDTHGELVKALQRVNKPAKVTIGPWGDAEPGAAATTKRFKDQLRRILSAAKEYDLEQSATNLGVAIITSRSGIVVIDIDAGKMPEPDNPKKMLDPDSAHQILLVNMLKAAKIMDLEQTELLAWFRTLVHVRTPSGGWHYYFRRKEGQRPRMHTGMIKYVDIRAGFQNEAGEWESSSVAYAPGNITQKGQYIAYEVGGDGQRVELKMLPAVSDLPELPDELDALFQKSTTEIRTIAAELGIPVPDTARTSANSSANARTKGPREGATAVGDMSKWDRLALQFVRAARENAGEAQ
jgi:hypothetical protein